MADPAVTLGWFVCLSVTMVTGDLHCLWNRVYLGSAFPFFMYVARLPNLRKFQDPHTHTTKHHCYCPILFMQVSKNVIMIIAMPFGTIYMWQYYTRFNMRHTFQHIYAPPKWLGVVFKVVVVTGRQICFLPSKVCASFPLKGHNMRHSGHTGQHFSKRING